MKRDPDQAVLAEVAEVARVVAVDAEIVRVDRPEQRIVGVGIRSAPQLQKLEPRLHIGGRQLEMVRRHVAVGARAAVAIQPFQPPIEECRNPRATASQGSPPHNVPGASGLLRYSWSGAGEILALLALISIDEQRTSPQAISKDGCFTMSLPNKRCGVIR